MASVMRKMNVLSRCEDIYRSRQSTEGLQGIYHSYVFAISKTPGLSQDGLAKYLCINKSSVTRHLSYLEERGYVERKVSEKDKRELLVYPTEKLINARPEIANITGQWNELIAYDISPDELEAFHVVLDKMVNRATELIYSGDKTK